MSKNGVVPPRFFFHDFFDFLHFIWFKQKTQKTPKTAFFVIFSFFWKRVQRIHPRVFCCKGRQSPWQKPANLYSTKCRIFMRQNLCRGSQCTTRARPSGETNIFFRKNIFYFLPEKFCPHKVLKKIFKKFFFFLKNIFWKIFL